MLSLLRSIVRIGMPLATGARVVLPPYAYKYKHFRPAVSPFATNLHLKSQDSSEPPAQKLAKSGTVLYFILFLYRGNVNVPRTLPEFVRGVIKIVCSRYGIDVLLLTLWRGNTVGHHPRNMVGSR
jgi:hypothetical protein